MALHGWLIVDKPVGPGSTQIVSAVKRALKAGDYPKVKVGHGGTLDPLASGVLPVALGEATKLCGRMLDANKIYEFTIRFGEETSTLDAEGEVIARSGVRPRLADIDAVLTRFRGDIGQVPPAYSALMIDGKRAYDRARAGEDIAMKCRSVTINDLSIRHPELGSGSISTRSQSSPEWMLKQVQHDGVDEITLIARVSKGTYIRSLARDIARALDTVGSVAMLRRTKAGPFTIEQAISLDKLNDLATARGLEQILLPLTAGLDDIPALPVTPDQARLLRQGRKVVGIAAEPGLHLATDALVPVALVEVSEAEMRVLRGFNVPMSKDDT